MTCLRRVLPVFSLVLLPFAQAGQSQVESARVGETDAAEDKPGADRATIARAVDLDLADLRLLDHQRLSFLFVPGRFESYVVRDAASGNTIEVTLDLDTGREVDPRDLRKQDRQLAAKTRGRIDAKLLNLLLRHPELQRVAAGVQWDFSASRTPHQITEKDWSALGTRLRKRVKEQLDLHRGQEAWQARLSAREIASLGSRKWVKSIVLLEDPEIPDDGQPSIETQQESKRARDERQPTGEITCD